MKTYPCCGVLLRVFPLHAYAGTLAATGRPKIMYTIYCIAVSLPSHAATLPVPLTSTSALAINSGCCNRNSPAPLSSRTPTHCDAHTQPFQSCLVTTVAHRSGSVSSPVFHSLCFCTYLLPPPPVPVSQPAPHPHHFNPGPG